MKTGWRPIDTQAQLDALDAAVCWEDSRVLEYYGSAAVEPHYPSDVCRTGHEHKDIHVLIEASSAQGAFLELVFIHCDWVGANVLDHPSLLGRVDVLKRVTLQTEEGEITLRCARVIHRWLDEASVEGRFYRPSAGGDLT